MTRLLAVFRGKLVQMSLRAGADLASARHHLCTKTEPSPCSLAWAEGTVNLSCLCSLRCCCYQQSPAFNCPFGARHAPVMNLQDDGAEGVCPCGARGGGVS